VAADLYCSWIGFARLDRLLLDRVEQQQRESEVVVPEGSPRVGSLPDPLESVCVTAYLVDAVALAGVAPHTDVKTGAGRRAVPMAFVVRRELMAHKTRTGRDGPDLVFGRTATEVFYASMVRARANKAWKAAGLEPLTPHEARHCAISYFIAAGLDWKQISTWAGHGDVRQTWNRCGHFVPGAEDAARERLDAFLTPTQPTPTAAHTVAHDPKNDETPENTGVLKYRYRDSNPGFRRERAAS